MADDAQYTVMLVTDSKSFTFEGERVVQLRKVSQVVANSVNNRIIMNPDDVDTPVEVVLENADSVCIEEAINYYETNNWNPPAYGKVTSSNINDIIQDAPGQALAKKYDHKTVHQLYLVANGLKMTNLEQLCLIRCAVEVYCPSGAPNSVQDMQKKLGLQDKPFNLDVEANLKLKYEFLN